MKPTIAWVRNQIEIWNQRCFGGNLPEISVRLTQARSYMGQMAYKRMRMPGGREVYSEFTMRLSVLFDHDEETVIDTIIHELIHCEIFASGEKDDAPHGRRFQRRMNEINRCFNRHITVSERLTQDQVNSDQRINNHLICLLRFADGRIGVCRVARTRIFDIWNNVTYIPGVKTYVWVWTRHPFFNRFPLSRKAGGYIVKPEELYQPLECARRLSNTGRSILTGDIFNYSEWLNSNY